MPGPLIIDLSGPQLTVEDKELLQHPQVGGVIFFDRHYQSLQQIQALIKDIRSLCKSPLLFCVDQEGGRVQRFKAGFTALPALYTLGNHYDKKPEQALRLATTMGWLMATELLCVGIDISFAPVVDLDRKINSCLAERCFHHDAAIVALLARAFRTGMRSAGMKAVAKHFPGHGGVAQDTHYSAAIDQRDYATILATDLRPFTALITDKIAALMVGHVSFPQIDDYPVSYSSVWLQDILRQRLNYQGLVFSDDLSMQGASILAGTPLTIVQRVQFALDAGCEMLLICNDRPAAIAALDHLSNQNFYNPTLALKLKSMYSETTCISAEQGLVSTKQAAQVELELLRDRYE